MEECHALFRDVVIPLFKELGIREVGYWEPLEKDGVTFLYLLGFESAAAREATWPRFIAHPLWVATKAAWTDGPPYASVKPTVLAPTDYSPRP
jgi:hypothetical protein